MNYSKKNPETVAFLKVTEPSEEIKKQLHNEALLDLTAKEQVIQTLVATHKKATPLVSKTKIKCTGQLAVAYAFVYNTLNLQTMNFPGYKKNYSFSGKGYGVGVGGGVAWYTGSFTLTPKQLVKAGTVDYSIVGTGIGILITFSKNGKVIGTVAAAGITVGSGGFLGKGKFY
ncbi:hypothetical protein KORDIASMS9_02094 [Kordia sp. SMS9]|uniref:hypothetical protein n=1 Tax=Kordia sp. SMS9 TaxID=2282170 RepID=UPI000E0E0217|nr:hypothetical protein [Kordia sp. SMS9]AXG69866.1 hypothetical protein KORDIASMS9_02094 [Kordia sp. SMS9]